MAKYIEINMVSGTKYYLVSTEDRKFKRQDIDYMLSGVDAISIQVNTTSESNSKHAYINPRLIESYTIIF